MIVRHLRNARSKVAEELALLTGLRVWTAMLWQCITAPAARIIVCRIVSNTSRSLNNKKMKMRNSPTGYCDMRQGGGTLAFESRRQLLSVSAVSWMTLCYATLPISFISSIIFMQNPLHISFILHICCLWKMSRFRDFSKYAIYYFNTFNTFLTAQHIVNSSAAFATIRFRYVPSVYVPVTFVNGST